MATWSRRARCSVSGSEPVPAGVGRGWTARLVPRTYPKIRVPKNSLKSPCHGEGGFLRRETRVSEGLEREVCLTLAAGSCSRFTQKLSGRVESAVIAAMRQGFRMKIRQQDHHSPTQVQSGTGAGAVSGGREEALTHGTIHIVATLHPGDLIGTGAERPKDGMNGSIARVYGRLRAPRPACRRPSRGSP